MFAIGEFARHGRVSIRMLRHYDAIGLLRPAHVDPATGYRSYTAAQLADLNRIVALKDLGFSLDQVATMIAGDPSPAELRTMLTLRRAQLETAVAESNARLAQVEARLRGLEAEIPAADIIVKELPAVRLVGLTATAASFTPDDITPVVHPLCAELGRRLPDSDVRPAGRLTCLYEQADEIVVRATVPAAVDAGGNLNGLEVLDLPGIRAATLVHRGPIDQVLPSWQALARWLEENDRSAAEPARELYLDTPEDPAGWVTELQQPFLTA
ncbi:MerR family transcriptional regulator [Kribbella jejuensis]|uniref:DNA-binding transcriptional MerR regulator n=1 Tax=Kribbella jejuensis TaxID=236068 RepID=A0A542DAR6_9ACTN|nr:MerR family transcriptional regulator [Kribbella jejuensis]TQJ00125.1 DNA-binding transcriptional MerR regulator [Kribbella jejuensis]